MACAHAALIFERATAGPGARASRRRISGRRGGGVALLGRRPSVDPDPLRAVRRALPDRPAQAGLRARPAPARRRFDPRSTDQDGGAMIVTDDQIREEITKAITENKVMLF